MPSIYSLLERLGTRNKGAHLMRIGTRLSLYTVNRDPWDPAKRWPNARPATKPDPITEALIDLDLLARPDVAPIPASHRDVLALVKAGAR